MQASLATLISSHLKMVHPPLRPPLRPHSLLHPSRSSPSAASPAERSSATSGTPTSSSSQTTSQKGTPLSSLSRPPSRCSSPSPSDALDQLQLKRYCCRRMVLTHVDLIEKLLHYNRPSPLSLPPRSLLTLSHSQRACKGQARPLFIVFHSLFPSCIIICLPHLLYILHFAPPPSFASTITVPPPLSHALLQKRPP